MNRIDKDKQTIRFMVQLYCKHKLRLDSIPDEYAQLIEYACSRLEHCSYGENKPACKNCATHCYRPEMRALIRRVMKWAGPRMPIYAPVTTLRHLLNH